MRRESIAVEQLPIPAVLEAIAFWGAIILPFAYLPPILVIGLETTAQTLFFFGLVGLNVFLIALGNRYRRE